MSKPDDTPQRVWDEADEAASGFFGTGLTKIIARAILAAEQREREACAEVVRKMIPSMPPDGPISTEHQVEYEALGFAMTAIRNRGSSHE